MDQALTFDKILIGHKYKVVKTPPYYVQRCPFEYMGRVGLAEWKNIHTGVCLNFNVSKDDRRQIPLDCLEEVKEPEKVLLTAETVRIGAFYKVISVPKWYIRMPAYPPLDKIGKCLGTHAIGVMLSFTELNSQFYIPFECVEEATMNDVFPTITDDELISKIVSNPLGTLKIVRGLAKMNKNLHLRSFLERGSI